MSFKFENLDTETRKFMVKEFTFDDAQPYSSVRFTPEGRASYPELLRVALQHGEPKTLEEALGQHGLFASHEQTKSGVKRVPKNAASVVAQSEFNRYYVRGVCARVLSEGGQEVEVYRARESSWSRPESEALVGTKLRASEILEDLRSSQGSEPRLLPDVNSGLSVRIIDR